MRIASLTFVAAVGIAAAGCGQGSSMTSEATDPEASNPHNCADIYAQDIFPTFEIQIAPEQWSAMQTEYQTWMQRQADNLDLKPYHPLISFKYGSEMVTDAYIKLQGNPSDHWTGQNMQFTVSFHEADPAKRFHGLRKVVFHAQP